MFSGKTSELIRRVRRAMIARMKVKVFKPAIDVRNGFDKVVSHDDVAAASVPVSHSSELYALARGQHVLAIDEAQFFDSDLPEVCAALAFEGHRIIVCGLDLDFLGRPFGPMPALLAISDSVTKLHAVCNRCGKDAGHSFRLSGEEEKLLLGGKDRYEPRCRKCFMEGMAEKGLPVTGLHREG